MIFRRHDRYYARQYLASLLAALAFLSVLVIVFDMADRLDDLPKAARQIEAAGRTRVGVLVEYYATLLPFLWMKLIPFSALIAAGLVFTWLARANELSPVVTAGVPSVRLLAPVIGVGVLLVVAMTVARETVVPDLARRHDDLHRVFKRSGRGDRLTDVKHLFDRDGGRVSMSAYLPAQRRMEAAWVTFRRQTTPSGPRDVVHYYPFLDWDANAEAWVASKGGTRCVLSPVDTGADSTAIAPGTTAPVAMRPSMLELTLRQGTALGFSSDEIRELADGYPENPRFRLLLHQQWAAPVSTLVLLLLGLPMVYRLGRSNVFRSFGATCGLTAAYFLADAVLTDMGARGALNPVVAAWAAHVVFGALGVVLMSTVDT
ncbi:MAG: LptF/LptG family permease [Planctomycetota bacterium]